MKKLLVVLTLVCTTGIGMAHAQEMKKGMSLANFGLGFVPGVGVNVSYDYGLVDTWGPGIFTIGGFIGFDNWAYNSDIRGTEWFFAPRATYRYAVNKSFEVYATAMLGAAFTTYSKSKGNVSGVAFGTTGGCRYSFSRNLSVFAEVGWNVSILNGGLSVSF